MIHRKLIRKSNTCEAIKTKQEVVLEKLFQNLNQEIEAVKREYGKWSEEVL